MRESRTSGSVRGLGCEPLVYSTVTFPWCTFRRSFYGLVYFYALFYNKETSFVYRTREVFC